MKQRPLPDAALIALDIPATEVRFPGVSSLETPKGKVWVKTLEPAGGRWRRAVVDLLRPLLPAILRPSKAGKGGDTLLLQAEQIKTLRAASLPVPDIHYSNHEFLILSDAGLTLGAPVAYERTRTRLGLSEKALQDALLAMTDTLAVLHQKGFAHGRPKIRDIGWQDGTATLLDLEERPWEVMPMATAQARDVFLWIMDLCSYPLSHEIAPEAMARLTPTMSADTERALRKLLRLLAAAAPVARVLTKTPLGNREIRGSVAAYDVMKAALAQTRD